MPNWSSLSTRIATSPLVICGPILRKTTVNEVSVWVALRAPADLKILLYDQAANPNSAFASNVTAVSAKCFGQKLYICTITLSGLSLSPSKTYGYDISFAPKSGYTYNFSFTSTKTLASNDVLSWGTNGMSKLTFTNSGISRPSFSLPPTNLNNLRIIHASCRKPHGPAEDALEGLHNMIRDSLVNPVNQQPVATSYNSRPHQMFMTGDQIYADDVADSMLRMVMDASTTLMGWVETLPNMPPPPQNNPLFYINPGSRNVVTIGTAKFSCEAEVCKSHLWTLGEFYCMYLFAWSPELWDNTSWPTFLAPDFYTSRGYYGTNVELAPFNEAVTNLNAFRQKLNNVRKALANVPVYMIFDDHDVTDDWNITKKWFTDVSNTTADRILCNAMTAYGVFQDWGNRPSYYFSGPGLNLLSEAQSHPAHPTSPLPINYTSIKYLVLPIYDAVFKHLKHNSMGISWHYSVVANPASNYEVLVTDCRTLRGFPDGDMGYPEVISSFHMASQIPALPGNTQIVLTIVVIPGPVFGVPFTERSKKATKVKFGVYGNDMEDWGMREDDTTPYLLGALAGRSKFNSGTSENEGRIALLTGDIHNGSTQRAQYWAKVPLGQTAGDYNIVIAHLTASALKNEAA